MSENSVGKPSFWCFAVKAEQNWSKDAAERPLPSKNKLEFAFAKRLAPVRV